MILTEATQRQLHTLAVGKAAMAFGINAMASKAIDSGDYEQIDMIRALASELADNLLQLASILGQIQIPDAA